MRELIAIFTLALSACHAPDSHSPVDADPVETQTSEQAVSRSVEADTEPQVGSKQSVHAFGGTIVGTNSGEWGGEIAFRENDGTSYTIVPDNSEGIFVMPYGVVALTGLAHLGTNRGTVHILSKSPDSRITATPLVQLPGAPCDVVKEGDRITMKIGYWQQDGPNAIRKFACYEIRPDRQLARYECPQPEADICFSG